jgi:hypothetical protein
MEIIRDSIGLLQRLERSDLLCLLSYLNAADGFGGSSRYVSSTGVCPGLVGAL